MSDSIEITPSGPVVGRIRPPGSKSITNRALVCAALASGSSTLTGALVSDDTGHMMDGLVALGIPVRLDAHGKRVLVDGCRGEIPANSADLFVGNSGTTVRFLTAAVGIGDGTYRLDGVTRMRERPIQDLLDALKQLGVDAQSEQGTGAPPVVVNAHGIDGGTAQVAGDVSSQYLSGLLMAAPYAKKDVRLEVEGNLVSQPYVTMTIAVMKAFGVDVEHDPSSFRIVGRRSFIGRNYVIEPDASAASYFWAAAAITRGQVTVDGLDRSALQGDVAFCDCLEQMGCRVTEEREGITVTGGALRGIDVDMGNISDTVQTLAAVALFAVGPTTIRGVAHNRHKETDRIGDLARELRRVGAVVEEFPDGMKITPGDLKPTNFQTYDDHRMAMSLALIGLKQPGIVILNPDCTAKTYPAFFDDLSQLCR